MQKLKVLSTRKTKVSMAKVSIDDRTEIVGKVHILPKAIRDELYNAASTTLDRLGDATRLIEVIKINPLGASSDDSEFVDVKVVIAYMDPYSADKTRIETGFQMFCHDNLKEFLSQGIVRSFRTALATRAEASQKEDRMLRDALVTLHTRELESGNANRCYTCGTMCIVIPDMGRVCPKCTPTTEATVLGPGLPREMFIGPPICQNCGNIGVNENGLYTCLNCGESLGKVSA